MRICTALVLMLIGATLVPLRAADPPKAAPAKADLDSFRTLVAPFLTAHCTKCHGAAKQEGDLTLHAISGDLIAGKDLDKWQQMSRRLKRGEMPPEDEKQPDPELIKQVTDWIEYLPITVDAQLPQDAHKTLRQRMEVTQQTYCWQCHQKMNNIGLTFENFDHFGRYRTTELDKPVDAAGLIEGTNDKSLDGKYANSIEMIKKLAESDRARQVIIRYAFRFWMGREENLGDARSLQAADNAYRESGGSMKALIAALLTSESFLYRTK